MTREKGANLNQPIIFKAIKMKYFNSKAWKKRSADILQAYTLQHYCNSTTPVPQN